MDGSSTPARKPPSCMGCVHHYITHDPDHRYGCRAFGFKSPQSPLRAVQDASQQDCALYQSKAATAR